ncbi:hypothetical protein D3C81_969270 [compost metagenome]
MMPSPYSVSIASEAQPYLLPTSLKLLTGSGVGVDVDVGVGDTVAPGVGVGVAVGVGDTVAPGVGVGVGTDGPPLLLSVVTRVFGPSVLQFPAASPACTKNAYSVPAASPDTS